MGKSVPRHEYHYLGPDGEGVGSLPDGVGAALGSDYCVHLLPSPARLAAALDEATVRGAPVVLLTPYFRDAELKRTVALLRAIPEGADVDVAVNDWGALRALRALFPWMTLSLGRLLTGQKRCPRIGISPRLTEAGRAWHGEGLFSSEGGRRYLAAQFGVTRFHLDDLPWSGESPMRQGEWEGEARFYIHSPWALVTVTDACPWIGGKSSAEVATCPRGCREGSVILREPSMGSEMVQRGKARFVDPDGNSPASAPARGAWARIRYGFPP